MADHPTQGIQVAKPKDRTSNKVAKEEARHRVPQQCLRGPSIVAKKAGSTTTGPRDPGRKAMEEGSKLSTQVRRREEQDDMVELEALAAGPSTSQATGGKLSAKANPSKAPIRD